MMLADVWWPTSTVLVLYTVLNLLQGLAGLVIAVELPRGGWGYRVLRVLLAVAVITCLGSAFSAAKLALAPGKSADEILWRIMGPNLLVRTSSLGIAVWAAAWLLCRRRQADA